MASHYTGLVLHWRKAISVKNGEHTRRTCSATFILQAFDGGTLPQSNDFCFLEWFSNSDSTNDNTSQNLIKGWNSYFLRFLWCVFLCDVTKLNSITRDKMTFDTNVSPSAVSSFSCISKNETSAIVYPLVYFCETQKEFFFFSTQLI